MTNKVRAVVSSINGSVVASVVVADERDTDALLRGLCAVRSFATSQLYPMPVSPRTGLERAIASAVKGLLTGSVIELSWTGDAEFIFSVEATVTVGKLTVRVGLALTRLTTEVWVDGARRFVRTTDPSISMLPIEELSLALVGSAVDAALAAVKAWSMGRCVVTRLLGSQVRVCPGARPIEAEASPKAEPTAEAVPAVVPPAAAPTVA